MDVLDYLRILRRRWRPIAVLCLLGVVLGGASVRLGEDEGTFYRATHTLAANGSGVNLDQAAALAVTGAVPERVATTIGGTAGGLSAQVRVVARREVGFLEVTAIGNDPARTTAVADAFAEQLSLYMTEFRNQSATTELATAEARLVELQTQVAAEQLALSGTTDPIEQAATSARIDALQAEAAQLEAQIARVRASTEGTTVLQTVSSAEAVPINGPEFRSLFESTQAAGSAEGDVAEAVSGGSSLGLVPRVALGGVLGLLAGVVAAIVLERVDPRLHGKAEVEATFGWPVITEIPPLTRSQQQERVVLAHVVPRSRTAEAYRVLRSSVQFAAAGRADAAPDGPSGDGPGRQGTVVLVSSPSPAEGKTTTVANLAVVLGEAGADVLVVNCDFRRPSLGAYLGVDSHLAKVVDSEVPNVRVLAQVTDDPEGANPADVVALQRAVIQEARRRFDYVLLDTAPLLTTNDANEVLDTADLVVLVARAGRTTREAADRCAELLERRTAPVLGLVLVATTEAPTGRYYYTGDYYLDADATPRGAGAGGDEPPAAPGGEAPGPPDGPTPASGQPSRSPDDATDDASDGAGAAGREVEGTDAASSATEDEDVPGAPVPVGAADDQAAPGDGDADETVGGTADAADDPEDDPAHDQLTDAADRPGETGDGDTAEDHPADAADDPGDDEPDGADEPGEDQQRPPAGRTRAAASAER